jgi:hypothetical protein
MKKLLLATNLLFMAIIYFQSCIPTKQVIVSPEGSRKNWVCLNYADSTFSGITYGTAYKMFETYGGNQFARITNNLNPNTDDSKFVWFSLDVIKKFIYKIEDTLHAKGADPSTRLGIRFYFAAYPDSNQMKTIKDLNQLPSSYGKRHTLFMVPTYDIASATGTIHQDFNAFEPLSTAKKPSPSMLLDSRTVKSVFTLKMAGLGVTNDIYIQNHGEIGPPPQPGTSFQ